MSGTVAGLDRNQYQPQLHGEKHTANVHRLCGEGSYKSAKGGDVSCSRKRKKTEEPEKDEEENNPNDKDKDDEDGSVSTEWIPMVDVVCEGKKKLQDAESKNGV